MPPGETTSPKIFGFSEFIGTLALMVLVWTLADVKYRFRVAVASGTLYLTTFALMAAIGVLSLLTEVWRAQGWWVPRMAGLSYALWQMILGMLFFVTFLTWMWYAFIRPPVYGRRNAKRYVHQLYRVTLKGSPTELPVIADELSRSAKTLIHYASDRGEFKNDKEEGAATDDSKKKNKVPEVTGFADDILLLIADKKFCRYIVKSSPITALAFFQEIGSTKKYGVPIEIFAKNITNEALENKDSFLFHESEGYHSGLIGYHKPLSQAMYANYKMVEAIGTLLDPDISGKIKWGALQWEAYCRIVLMTFRNYVEHGHGGHSFVLYRAQGYIEHAVFDLYKINGMVAGTWDDEVRHRLGVVVRFLKDAIRILNEKGSPRYVELRVRDDHRVSSVYDNIAKMIFEVMFAASAVRAPRDLCWWIQHNSVWGEVFNFSNRDGVASKIIHFKVRRLLYNEIVDMSRFPNFKGAKILGFVLNVLGLRFRKEKYFRDSNALHKAVLSWTRRNYAWLYTYNPRVAEACLVDGITYDQANLRLVQTYPAEGLRREAAYVYLELDPPSLSSGVKD
ncbi:MAG: hypothetical protein M3461_18720 [Pseudomonadota bacterium]|nr:hypothetical protein [Pseudomonadota bacterium]